VRGGKRRETRRIASQKKRKKGRKAPKARDRSTSTDGGQIKKEERTPKSTGDDRETQSCSGETFSAARTEELGEKKGNKGKREFAYIQ